MIKMSKKIGSILIAVCIIILCVIPVSGAASDSAAAQYKDIRIKMIARESEIPFSMDIPIGIIQNGMLNEYMNEFFDSLLSLVFQHDDTLKGGDYLKKHTGMHGLNIPPFSYDPNAETVQVTGSLQFEYYTTAAQETELDEAMRDVLDALQLKGLTDYQKIVRIYNYITSHVVYDYKNLNDESYKLKYSAYAALVNGTSVCQGYANLFYLFMQHAGIDCRIITGIGTDNEGKQEPHAWNIVKLGDLYYFCDATWDSNGIKTPRYLLRGLTDFPNHYTDEEFLTEEFKNAYPIANSRFIEPQNHEHIAQTISAVKPTCTKPGLTEGEVCAECGMILVPQEEIPANGHKEIEIPEIPATCIASGYTSGVKCSVCGEILQTPAVVDALGHDMCIEEVLQEATDQSTGICRVSCSRCEYYEDRVIPVKENTYLLGDVDQDGKITASDARLALRCSVGLEKYASDSAPFLAGDVDRDGRITAGDARTILRVSVHLESL